MENQTKRQSRQLILELFIAFFVFVSGTILFYFTVVVNGKDLFSSGKEYILKVKFRGVGALAVNDKVCVLGMHVGKVKKLIPEKRFEYVIAVLSIKQDIPIYSDYSVSIRNSSVFGGEFVLINPGSYSSVPLPADITLKGKPPIDLIYEASDLVRILKKDAEELRRIIEDERFLENISKAAKGLNEGAQKFDEFLNTLKSKKGTLGKLISDPSIYDDTRQMFENIRKTSENLNAILGKIKEGEGSLGKLLADDSAYDKILKALDDIAVVAEKMTSSKGSLGRMMSDDGKLYDTLYDSIKISGELAKQLKKGQGSLGKLITDDKLYDEMLETVRQIRAVVENYRGQAPVATFGSMALGAF